MSQLFRIFTSDRPQLKRFVRPVLSSLYFQRPFVSHKLSVLIIYFPSVVSISQVDAFFHYSSDLSSDLNVDLRAMSIGEFLQSTSPRLKGASAVILQTWFELGDQEKEMLSRQMRKYHPDARIIYFDWFAHLDLRLAEFFADKIDVYVKRQRFRDLREYKRETLGVNNLEDYYGKLYGLNLPRTKHRIPDDFFKKVVLGPGFFTSRLLRPNFGPQEPPDSDRPIDVHARMTAARGDWYGLMRTHALEAVQAIKGLKILTIPNAKLSQFHWELRNSKICFSPFGYGEVCWRDYEAIMTGSLLIKPDVSHLVTHPDIFIPFQTYIPLKWDFSDLQEKIRYYISHETERREIAQNAYRVIHQYIAENKFLTFANAVLSGSS